MVRSCRLARMVHRPSSRTRRTLQARRAWPSKRRTETCAPARDSTSAAPFDALRPLPDVALAGFMSEHLAYRTRGGEVPRKPGDSSCPVLSDAVESALPSFFLVPRIK